MRIIEVDENSLLGNTSVELSSENLLNNAERVDSGRVSSNLSSIDSGGSVSTGAGFGITKIDAVVLNPIDKNPIPIIRDSSANGTINKDVQYVFSISSNIEGASIIIDGENTFKTTPNTTKIFLSDVAVNNVKTIEIQKEGFVTSEKYEIDLIPNPEFGDTQFKAVSELSQREFSFDRFGSEIKINAADKLQLSNISPFVVRVKYFEDKNGNGLVVNGDYNEKIRILEFTKLVKPKQ
jgi:hypothetical protein